MSDESPFSDPFDEASSNLDTDGAPTHEADAFDEGVDEIEVDALSSTHPHQSNDEVGDVDPFAAVDNTNTPGPSFDSFSHLEESKEEESALAQWENERKIVLADRQQKAEDTKFELLSKAKEDLVKFYSDAKLKLEKQGKINRADEKIINKI